MGHSQAVVCGMTARQSGTFCLPDWKLFNAEEISHQKKRPGALRSDGLIQIVYFISGTGRFAEST
jgi:hypothetical protein